jgi:hypothetical protein
LCAYLFPGGGLCVVGTRFEPALQDSGNAQGTDNCPGRKARMLQEDEGDLMVNTNTEQLFPRHLINMFRENALEEAMEAERRAYAHELECEEFRE